MINRRERPRAREQEPQPRTDGDPAGRAVGRLHANGPESAKDRYEGEGDEDDSHQRRTSRGQLRLIGHAP